MAPSFADSGTAARERARHSTSRRGCAALSHLLAVPTASASLEATQPLCGRLPVIGGRGAGLHGVNYAARLDETAISRGPVAWARASDQLFLRLAVLARLAQLYCAPSHSPKDSHDHLRAADRRSFAFAPFARRLSPSPTSTLF